MCLMPLRCGSEGKTGNCLNMKCAQFLGESSELFPWHRELLPRADTAETNTRVTQHSPHSSPYMLLPPDSSGCVKERWEGLALGISKPSPASLLWSPFSHSLKSPRKGEKSQGRSQTSQDSCRATQHPWMQMGRQCFNFIPDPNLTPTVLAPIHVPLCSPAGYPAPNLTLPAHHHAPLQLSQSRQRKRSSLKHRLHPSPPRGSAALQLFLDPNWILLFIFVLPPILVLNPRPAALELLPNAAFIHF